MDGIIKNGIRPNRTKSSVRRRLFDPPTPAERAESRRKISEFFAKENSQAVHRWNFDFQQETALVGRYVWQRVGGQTTAENKHTANEEMDLCLENENILYRRYWSDDPSMYESERSEIPTIRQSLITGICWAKKAYIRTPHTYTHIHTLETCKPPKWRRFERTSKLDKSEFTQNNRDLIIIIIFCGG